MTLIATLRDSEKPENEPSWLGVTRSDDSLGEESLVSNKRIKHDDSTEVSSSGILNDILLLSCQITNTAG